MKRINVMVSMLVFTLCMIINPSVLHSKDTNTASPSPKAISDSIKLYIGKTRQIARYSLDTAFMHAWELDKFQQQCDSSALKAESLLTIGLVHFFAAQYDSSRIYYDKALIHFNEASDQKGRGRVYFELGYIFIKQGELPKALDYYQKAFEIFENGPEKDRDPLMAMYCLSSLGTVYAELKNNEKAVEYFRKAISRAEEANLLEQLSGFSLNLGVVYRQMEQYKLARQALQRSISIKKALKRPDHYNYISLYNEYSAVLERLNQIDSAFHYIHLARYLIKKSGVDVNQELNYEIIIELHKKRNNTDSALYYFERYHQLKQEQYSSEKTKIIQDLEHQYQARQQAQQIKVLEQDNEIQRLKNNSQRQNLFIGTAILLILLIISGLLFYLYQLSRRSNAKIKKQNELISQTLKEKDILMHEIHHRTKNNLNIIESILSIQTRSAEKKDTRDALEQSKNRVQAIRLIHQQLFQNELYNEVNMKNYLEAMIDHIKKGILPFHIQLTQNLEDLNMKIDQAVPLGLLINEAITNAIKYAFPNGQKGAISLSLQQPTDDHIQIEIVDDGVGLNEKELTPSLSKFKFIKGLSKQLKGKLELNGSTGTKLSLLIPYIKNKESLEIA